MFKIKTAAKQLGKIKRGQRYVEITGKRDTDLVKDGANLCLTSEKRFLESAIAEHLDGRAGTEVGIRLPKPLIDAAASAAKERGETFEQYATRLIREDCGGGR